MKTDKIEHNKIMIKHYICIKQWTVLLLLVSFFPTVCAQTPTNTIQKDTNKEKEIFIFVEENPEFPGGEEARQKFLQDNIVYPKKAQEKMIQGRVVLYFTVETTGEITEIKVAQSVHPLLDNEALRVAKLMPNWKPAKQRNKAVRVQYSMPITFTLDRSDISTAQILTNTIQKDTTEEDMIFVIDEYPEFPGGEEARQKFLRENLVYPQEILDICLEGRVMVGFVVEIDGSITNVEIVSGRYPALDKEALRVTKSMPKWKPGKYQGKIVPMQYQMPVIFRLD
jgi:TonB family protein